MTYIQDKLDEEEEFPMYYIHLLPDSLIEKIQVTIKNQ